MRPSIVVVGSGEPGRQYDPPLRHAEDLSRACEELGRELAAQECDLMVFSSSEKFVEQHVVRGYLEAGGSTVVARAPHQYTVDFSLPADQAARVVVEPDTSEEWEVSYYRSVLDADGIVMVGGGRATRVAGLLAVLQGKAVAPVGGFGGAAQTVWQRLDRFPHHSTAEERALMGRPWSAESAPGLVTGLLAQRRRRHRAEQDARRGGRGRVAGSVTGIGALLLAMCSILVTVTTGVFPVATACLLLGPMFAGLAGALLRGRPEEEAQLLFSSYRGLGAGVVTSLLYVASQLLTNGEALTVDSARRLIWFVVVIGFVAGYTFDAVYTKLAGTDVADTSAVTSPGEPTLPAPRQGA